MMKAYPLITVITVVYNDAQYLEDTITNVLNLKYPNLEYIIIDGGSKDETLTIIKKYINRLKYFISEADKGIYDAMNKGWINASFNSYILYLGAGDKLITLPSITNLINDADIIVGNVYLGKNRLFTSKVDFRLKLGNTIHHQAMLVKKETHPSPPFSLKYKTYADFDFNQRLYLNKKSFRIDKEFTAFAIEGGISTKFNKKESLQIVKKNFGFKYVCLAYVYYFIRSM